MTAAARLFRSTILVLAALAVSYPASAEDAQPPVLRIPGFPPVPLPPGSHVFGPQGIGDAGRGLGQTLGQGAADDRAVDRPGADIYHEFGTVAPGGGRGRVPDTSGMVIGPGGAFKPPARADHRPGPPKSVPKAAPTPEEKQAQIRRALIPQQPLSTVRRKTLDELYGKLAGARDENEAKGVASLIMAVWLRSGSDTATLLMARADSAIAKHDYPLAMSVLDRLVELQPGWAEAWNKRASARYLAGDLNGSMADVDRVLRLEPNHFAALNGLAMILHRTGFNKRALQVYRRELAIYPHQAEIEQLIDKLSAEVEGQGI